MRESGDRGTSVLNHVTNRVAVLACAVRGPPDEEPWVFGSVRLRHVLVVLRGRAMLHS